MVSPLAQKHPHKKIVYLSHSKVEEEDSTEEAGDEQEEIDRRGAGHLDHQGQETVQGIYAEGVGRKQYDCGGRHQGLCSLGTKRKKMVGNKVK